MNCRRACWLAHLSYQYTRRTNTTAVHQLVAQPFHCLADTMHRRRDLTPRHQLLTRLPTTITTKTWFDFGFPSIHTTELGTLSGQLSFAGRQKDITVPTPYMITTSYRNTFKTFVFVGEKLTFTTIGA